MNDIKRLITLILEDKQKSWSYDRYPIRFLFMNFENDVYDQILNLCTELDKIQNDQKNSINEIKIINLSDLLNKDDGWVTKDKVLNYLKTLDKSKDYIVLGFSELIRFYSRIELEPLIISLMTDIENNEFKNKHRIYMVCFSLFEKIQTELKTNSRNESINPIIKIDEETNDNADRICVYYANSDFDNSLFSNKIYTAKEWLDLYKNENLQLNKGIVCISDTLIKLYEKAKPDNFVLIEKVDSYYKILTLMLNVDIKFVQQSDFNEKFWNELYKYAISNQMFSIREITKKYLNVLEIDDNNFIELFSRTNIFGKTLLHLFCIENSYLFEHSEYLCKILNESKVDEYNSFEKNIVVFYSILDGKTYFNGRKFFINKLNNVSTFKDFALNRLNDLYIAFLSNKNYDCDFSNEKIQEIDANRISNLYSISFDNVKKYFEQFYNDYLKYLIINIPEEIAIIISLLQGNIISIKEVSCIFPIIGAYLGNTVSEYASKNNNWIVNYLYYYKSSKLYNYPNQNLIQYINNYSDSFPLWYVNENLKLPMELIKKGKDYDKLIVLDGVGAEYFDYLIYIIELKNRKIIKADICKCFLPSITSINKEHYKDLYDEWETDFDSNYIHEEFYKSNVSIPKSLLCLERIIEKVITKYPNERIALIADHGATAIGKIMNAKKKYNFDSTEHEGRCMKINEQIYLNDNVDYNVYDSIYDGKWLLSTREFSLNDNPKRETHGGATIEETMVPCIVIDRNDSLQKEVSYVINVKSKVLSGLNRSVEIEIVPKTNDNVVLVEEDGTQHLMEYVDKNIWTCEIKNIKTQRICIKIANTKKIIEVQGSMGANVSGGDGFDD